MSVARASDWQTEPMPASCTTIMLDRTYSSEEFERIKAGLIPEQMEDKWFIYWDGTDLWLHRSWSGMCTYRVRIVVEEQRARLVSAVVNRDFEQHQQTDDDHDARMIPALIDVLLLRLPPELPLDGADRQERALATWSIIGRAMTGIHPGDAERAGRDPLEGWTFIPAPGNDEGSSD